MITYTKLYMLIYIQHNYLPQVSLSSVSLN